MCNILHLYNSASKLSSLATMCLFPWVTWGRHEIDRTSLSVIQLKNDWSYNSTPHIPSWHTQGWTEHQFSLHHHPYWLATLSDPTNYPHQPHSYIHTVCFHVGVRLGLLGPEDESNMILRNTRNHSADKTMLHYRRWGTPSSTAVRLHMAS